ncbi:zinc finger CCCH domain-containing protein 4 [Zea mays]|uniref:zinc finger CCCH domain-containing protein 4 n=1 Tax=Zea mays TaxID=4577 RepID=UPI000C6C50C4|nr:zinc finger CCCH domain-containing protein 4 [Zea mays]|eukprot:XP_023157000.1 zinc finger CCCH domain-containing protein 4 [Zea mays]
MVIRSSRLSHSGISHLPADEVKPLVKYDNDEDAHSPSGRGRGRGGRGRGRGRGRGGRGNGFNEYADAGWEDDHSPAYMGNGYARGRGRGFRGRGRRGGDNNQPEYQQVGGYYEEAPVHAPALDFHHL